MADHPQALAALLSRDDLERAAFLQALGRWGRAALVRAALAAARAALPVWEARYRAVDNPRRAIRAAERWLACPCPTCGELASRETFRNGDPDDLRWAEVSLPGREPVPEPQQDAHWAADLAAHATYVEAANVVEVVQASVTRACWALGEENGEAMVWEAIRTELRRWAESGAPSAEVPLRHGEDAPGRRRNLCLAVLMAPDEQLRRYLTDSGPLEALLSEKISRSSPEVCNLFDRWRGVHLALTDRGRLGELPMAALEVGELTFGDTSDPTHAIFSETTRALARHIDEVSTPADGSTNDLARLRDYVARAASRRLGLVFCLYEG